MLEIKYHSNIKWFGFFGICVGILLAFVIFPLFYSLGASFTNYSLTRPGHSFIGFKNYLALIISREAQKTLLNTALIVIGAMSAEMTLGLVIAFLLNRKIHIKGIAITLFVIPSLIAPTAVGAIWKLLLQPNGVLNYFWGVFGGQKIDWFGKPNLALLSIIIADIWQWTPFVTLLILAGLSSIPVELYEAAQVDGVNAFQNFCHVTLPGLKTTLLVALLFRTIDIIRFMDKIWIMTRGGPGISTQTAAVFIYLEGFRFFRIGYSSAASWIILLIISVLITLLFSIIQEEQ